MSERLAGRVLLIGWDAADWKVITPLLEDGKMPNLERLVDEGAMGNLATLQPVLSPMLWTSIATGKRADKHGILGFVEPDSSGASLRPVTSTSRKCKALWNILSQSGLRSAVVGWFASHPAERINGCVITDHYEHTIGPKAQGDSLSAGTVHPPELLATMADLRVSPTSLTAQQLLPFVPQGARIDQDKDRRLHGIAKILAECSTIHNAATWLAEHETWDLLAVYYDAIDHFCHGFMRYHPPKMDHIPAEDFEIYKDVVDAAYRFHDMMLGRLLTLVGPETTVVLLSDHGFHSDHLRPRQPRPRPGADAGRAAGTDPVTHHRNYGVLVVRGPHVKRDERVYGATLLDVAPTVLAMLGLAIPEDMDGKALTQIFERPVTLDRVATYEEPHPDDGISRESAAEDPWVAQQMLAHLVELGYVDAPGENQQEAVRQAIDDRQANLALVHFGAGRTAEALKAYQALLERNDTPRLRLRVARCLLRLGRTDEARTVVKDVLKTRPESPAAHLLLGSLSFEAGEIDEALAHLERAEQVDARLPHLHEQLAQVYIRQRRWGDAERAARRALDIDGDSPVAHDVLGVALRRLGRCEDAVYHHMCSISLLHHRPLTHVHLGLALTATGQIDWAIRAFNVAIELAPDFALPHHLLAEILERRGSDPEKARAHRDLAEQLRGRGPDAGKGGASS